MRTSDDLGQFEAYVTVRWPRSGQVAMCSMLQGCRVAGFCGVLQGLCFPPWHPGPVALTDLFLTLNIECHQPTQHPPHVVSLLSPQCRILPSLISAPITRTCRAVRGAQHLSWTHAQAGTQAQASGRADGGGAGGRLLPGV